ncbi:bifunctional DNA primase/polymerase [Streptomyces sp. NPDC097619]|uniref:bifunctional DNA primase/polymerase n=1 Tax=Streptomyces sp. NPDC097619 TaxID=3157228 RepID=UPI003325A9AF
MPESRTVARWCAERGWPVHPLAAGQKTPPKNCMLCQGHSHQPAECACIPAGRWCHGFHAATTDPARIDMWWGGQPNLGVGVATGAAGLVVIDIDAHGGEVPARNRILPGIEIGDYVDLTGLASGYHTLGVLAALRGAQDPAWDEDTLRVRTPSGGLHLWYRAGEGRQWQCSSGSSRTRALAWQVDVRAVGGYVVAPGTVTKAGAYEVLGTCRTPAELPEWLAGELVRTGHLMESGEAEPRAAVRRTKAVGTGTSPVGRPSRRSVGALTPLEAPLGASGGSVGAGGPSAPRGRQRGPVGPQKAAVAALSTVLAEVAACGTQSHGTGFSEKLNRAAYTVGGLVAAGHIEEAAGAEALRVAAEHARPGQEARARQIIVSGMNAGRMKPLYAGGRS